MTATDSIRWRDRVTIAEYCLSVGAIVLARMLEGARPSERDWQDVTLSLHRLRALLEMPS